MRYTRLRTGSKDDLKVALVSGPTGLLGREVCLSLAKEGWKVGLLCHRDRHTVRELDGQMRTLGCKTVVIAGNLLDSRKIPARMVAQARDALGPAHLLVHAASLPVKTSSLLEVPVDLQNVFTLHVTAYLALTAAVLPEMLRAQTGTIISVLSHAMLAPGVPGWHAYTIAKAGLAQATNEIALRYGSVGIKAVSIVPGALSSPSKPKGHVIRENRGSRSSSWTTTDARLVADLILKIVHDDNIIAGASLRIETDGTMRQGKYLGWISQDDGSPQESTVPFEAVESAPPVSKDPLARQLSAVIRRTFHLPQDEAVDKTAIGSIKDWDSLGHIKLIMEIESAFGIQFDSSEAANLSSYSSILRSLKCRLSAIR